MTSRRYPIFKPANEPLRWDYEAAQRHAFYVLSAKCAAIALVVVAIVAVFA